MKPNKVFCFFEQSGTFKNEFKKLGIPAEDYDILNDFGQTDHVTDLFHEIEEAYEGRPSVFDQVGGDDLIMAFFPCVRFSKLAIWHLNGTVNQLKGYTMCQKYEYAMRFHSELSKLYELICKMFIVCDRKGLKMVVENPYSKEHYLTRYFPGLPAVIDMDRTKRGDYQTKPTQYFFSGFKASNNLILEEPEPVQHFTHMEKQHKCDEFTTSRTVQRSVIHPQYANRFIREFILDAYNTQIQNQEMIT